MSNDIKSNLDEIKKAKKYADHFGLAYIELPNKKIPDEIINLIPEKVAKEYQIIAYDRVEQTPPIVKIAVADPERLKKKAPVFLADLKKKKGVLFELAIVTPTDFNKALKYYKSQTSNLKPQINKEEVKSENNISKTNNSNQVDLKNIHIPLDVLNKFPREVALKYKMIVFESPKDSNIIKVAMVNTEDVQANEILNFISQRNNLKVEKYEISLIDFNNALKLYGQIKVEPTKPKEPEIKKEEKKPEILPKKEIEEREESIKTPPVVKKVSEIDASKASKNGLPATLASKAPEVTVSEVKGQETSVQDEENHPTIIPTGVEEHAGEKNLDKLLGSSVLTTDDLVKIIKTGFVPKIVGAILYLAVKTDASDIHIEASHNELRLRYRIDGILRDIVKMPINLHPPIVSRIKILAHLKIDEQRIPQDGRFEVMVEKREIDLRVSTLPTIYGEKVVMRVLDKSKSIYTLEKLGMTGDNLKKVKENINQPYGIILVTGPTGSGKSTTLYAILGEISNEKVNVVTLEDPVEYEIEGINQSQIKPKIGFGFAEGLRSIVRQDPNIIMVGEIRDAETANLSTNAALTGHLVLSTLHTNDASGALPRLINMGVEPFLITSSINAIIAQRLVRKLCPNCKQEKKIPATILQDIKEELSKSNNKEVLAYKDKPLKFYEAKGCEKCGNGGYKGRIGLYEVMPMSEKIEDLAVNKMPASEIQKEAIKEGMITMKQDGLIKAIQGVTTLDEVMRVTTT